MKNSINEIDSVFREKLLDYVEDVSPTFWKRLSIRLYGRKIISGVTAILILLFGLAFWMTPELNRAAAIEQSHINNKELTPITNQSKTYETDLNSQIINNTVNASVDINKDENIITNNKPVLAQSLNEELKPTADVITNNKEVKESMVPKSNNNISNIMSKETSGINSIQVSKKSIFNKQNSSIISPIMQNNTFSRFSFSGEVGYDVSWKKLESDNQYNDFKNYRIENEQPNSNLSFGLKFNYQFKNWIISTGLLYTSISEELNYNIKQKIIDPDAGYYNIDTAWVMIYDMDQNLVPMIIGYERTWVDEYKYEVYNVDNSNQYNYLEIPISLGYMFNMKRFSICPTAGMSFGFLYSASGKLLQMDSVAFTALNKDSKYLQQSISNINFALSFEYSITPNYGIYIKPYYKQGLNSIYTNYPLSAKYRNAGVKFGINIYIN